MAGVGSLLALNAGLRLGELCALQYKDIDLCNGVIHVTKTAQRMKKGHAHPPGGATAENRQRPAHDPAARGYAGPFKANGLPGQE